MRVHHLNCGTLTPLIVGRLVCHVLLVESADGLILVDSGFGLADCADHSRVGPARLLLNAKFRESETAARQVEALGFTRGDVRHIVITHFDLDHVGGLSDFPDAVVHTTATEFDTANHPPTRPERRRYRQAQWAHGPKIQTYSGAGDRWNGFDTAYPMAGVDGISIVPMPGHTRGHAVVAVDAGERGWLVHAGDAAFDRSSIALDSDSPDDRKSRPFLTGFEWFVGQDKAAIKPNHQRLTELRRGGVATVFTAHDPVLFDRLAAENP